MSEDFVRTGAQPELLATWREAEIFAAAHMRILGFVDAQATPLGVDGGIDVNATGAVAQVKHYTGSPVGSPAVQRIRGVAHGNQLAIFYALNGYSSSAVVFANSSGVALFAYDLRGHVTAASDRAHQLLAHRHVRVDPNLASNSRDTFLSELEAYGQRVLDTAAVVVDYMGIAIEHAMETPESLAAFAPRANGLMEEALELKDLQEDLGNSRARPTKDWLDNIIRAEGVVQLLAARFDLDYDDFARLAGRARANGCLEEEGRRKKMVSAKFNDLASTQVGDSAFG